MFVQLWRDILTLLNQNGGVYLQGIANTLILATIGTFLGCLIGFLCGILNTIPHTHADPAPKRAALAVIRAVIRIYVEVFRGTPMILQAVFIYYGLPYFTNNALQFNSMWGVAIFVVSINTGAYIAESVRGGIISVDPGQTEGARAIGMTHFQTMRYVILPQALRNLLPQIGNNFIINIKDTSVMFIIGFAEFFSVHKMVSGASYQYFPSATVEMAGYLTLTLLSSFLLRKLEKLLDGDDSYEIVTEGAASEFALVNEDQLVMAAGTYTHRDPREKARRRGHGKAKRPHAANGHASHESQQA